MWIKCAHFCTTLDASQRLWRLCPVWATVSHSLCHSASHPYHIYIYRMDDSIKCESGPLCYTHVVFRIVAMTNPNSQVPAGISICGKDAIIIPQFNAMILPANLDALLGVCAAQLLFSNSPAASSYSFFFKWSRVILNLLTPASPNW